MSFFENKFRTSPIVFVRLIPEAMFSSRSWMEQQGEGKGVVVAAGSDGRIESSSEATILASRLPVDSSGRDMLYY